MGLSASQAASWESAGAAKASALGKFAVVTIFSGLQLCLIQPRAEPTMQAEPRANQQRTAGRTGPRLQPGHRPVDPQIRQYLFSRMAHGVVVLECGLRVWRALRSTGTACRRCRAGSPTAPGPLQPHTQRPLPPLRDFCCIKANVGGQDPEIALDGEATPPEAPPPQAPPQSMGDAARNFGWAISALS